MGTPREAWVPQDHMHESAEDCLDLHPEQPAIKVVAEIHYKEIKRQRDEMLEFLEDCGNGMYVPRHTDRVARDMVRTYKIKTEEPS